MEEIKIQIKFTIEDFTDCLYLTFDEYNSLTKKQIEDIKLERFNAYKNPVFVEDTE